MNRKDEPWEAKHAVSIDVEDWYQSTVDESAPLSDRFVGSTRRVLDALASHGVKATFFVLGMAAEKSPEIVRAIAEAGHEIQSHGYSHVEVFKMTEAEFREDLRRSKGLLENLLGTEIYGFRAPSFSIDERTPWALDVLAETGHRYDSSIFPIKMARYGIDGYPPEPRIVTTPRGHRLVEAPIACVDWMGKRWPVGGGGYFRLWPYWVIRKAWRQMESHHRPGILYFHPYEYDPSEMSSYGSTIPLRVRLHQGLGRSGFPGKVDRLLTEFQVGSLQELLADLLKEVAR
jgi:polysaccharide deacetylase family protein (PEP-CTERM system associated)